MLSIYVFVLFLDFIYLVEKRERESTWVGEGAEREAEFPLSREPDSGLIPGSWDHGLSQKKPLNDWVTQVLLLHLSE